MTPDPQPIQTFLHQITQHQTPAAAIAIAIDGQPTYTHVAGQATPTTPATEDTLWPLASISKLYTASAVMSLVEEGALGLWTKPSTIFPAFTGDGRDDITLRHLLTHTSGLGFAPANIVELLQAGATADALIAHGYTDPLLFPPGTGQNYSDTGYGLAGLMAAEVAGVSFPELVRTRVLEPAGLTQTFFGLPAELHPRVARVAGANGEGTDWAIYSSRYGSQIAHPAYGAIATVSDVLRFLLHFVRNGLPPLHGPAAERTLTTDQTVSFRGDVPGYPIYPWGAGFALQTGPTPIALASPQSFGHFGGTGCAAWIEPVEGVTVAFVSNSHVMRGRDEWLTRLEQSVNLAIATAAPPSDRAGRVGFRG